MPCLPGTRHTKKKKKRGEVSAPIFRSVGSGRGEGRAGELFWEIGKASRQLQLLRKVLWGICVLLFKLIWAFGSWKELICSCFNSHLFSILKPLPNLKKNNLLKCKKCKCWTLSSFSPFPWKVVFQRFSRFTTRGRQLKNYETSVLRSRVFYKKILGHPQKECKQICFQP